MTIRAFLSRSFSQRHEMKPIVDVIIQIANGVHIEVYDFVTRNTFEGDYKAMMQKSFAELRASDFVIAEVSHKAIGVGIEIGYAVAINKPILYLRRESAEYSTTVGGVATHALVYADAENLALTLPTVMQKMIACL